jgi:hypothetical protein
MRPQDGENINPDKTLRFVATDTTDQESVSLKLYFKDQPINKVFYSQNEDPTFENSRDDCKINKIINDRLYDRSAAYAKKTTDQQTGKAKYNDIKMPTCITVPDNGQLKTNYINVYTLPEGVRLDSKCMKGEYLNKGNSCLSYLRIISSGLLHAIKILNMGTTFYRHGNIFPHNTYLLVKNDTQRVFLDNMLYDNNKYSDISQKPFRRDFNMMADTLIDVLTGTNKTVVQEPVKSTFDLFMNIKKYFVDNSLDISLKSAAINMIGNHLKEGNGKMVTRAEFEFKLKKSVFNFIYRLKCTGTNPYNQFDSIEDALKHEFITSGALTGAMAPGEQWDSLPADF